jgi:tRNA(Ile)-lysidine synthase
MNACFESGYCQFRDFLSQYVADNLKIGIGVSGGPDSILLLHYMYRYINDFPEKNIRLLMIHIVDGHQLVDAELVAYVKHAKALVRDLSSRYSIPLVCYEHTNASLFCETDSIESLCHRIRKEYFVQAIKTYSLDYICLGHNEDDQIEHFFIGLLRKSSLGRIAGMEVTSERYMRPLLFLSKQAIRDILTQGKYSFCDDPCNARTEYLRNSLRSIVIPSLEHIDSRFRGNLLAIMGRIKRQNQYIFNEAASLVSLYGNQFDINFFLGLHEVIQYQVLEIIALQYLKISMSESFYKECIRFLCHKKSIVHRVKKICMYKKKNMIIFETRNS